MRIGLIVSQSGFSRDTIRYYERLGLLGEISKNTAYKTYPQRVLRRLALIKTAKNMGFTLSEIMDVIEAWDTDHLNVEQKKLLLSQKLQELEAKAKDLEQLKQTLQTILLKVNEACED